jgi:hypothetical protein
VAAKSGILPEDTCRHPQGKNNLKQQHVPESQMIIYLLRILHEQEIPFRISLKDQSFATTVTIKCPGEIFQPLPEIVIHDSLFLKPEPVPADP